MEKMHGDYATAIAFQISRVQKRKPIEIAHVIREEILQQKQYVFEKIEIGGSGFINFFLSQKYLQEQLGQILRKRERFGRLSIGQGKKTNVEFISANPTGPLHIGNGRNAFFGDVIANVLEAAGYRVTREYYVNDAKSSKQIMELGKTALGRGRSYLTEKLKTQISKLKTITQISKLSEGEIGFRLAKIIQRDTRNFITKKLKIRIDNWFSEEELYETGKIQDMFRLLRKKKLLYQKDGAWWLKTSQFGAEKDWVVVRENGEPTYLLSDIAYHKDKFTRGFRKIIDIWGADHQAHVSKMKAAVRMLGYKGEMDIVILQLVTLAEGEKLSKRRGKIVTLEQLVDEVGLDVARFFYLQNSPGVHMRFDIAFAKEKSKKNPVYYVQYAYARSCSIIRRLNIKKRIQPTKKELKLLSHPSELALAKQLLRFPEVIEDTARDFQAQRLPQYVVEIATTFHQFYRDCRVISANQELTHARIALVFAAKIVLKNAFDIMGISAPEKM